MLLFGIIILVSCSIAWMICFSHLIFWSVLPEFIAGFLSGTLGIVLGFAINGIYESSKLQVQTQLVLKSIKKELNLNLAVVEAWESSIKERKELFRLFKTNTWNTLSNRLDSLKSHQLTLDLAELYWELDLFNETRKKAESLKELEYYYSAYGFDGAEDVLNFLKGYLNDEITAIEEQVE